MEGPERSQPGRGAWGAQASRDEKGRESGIFRSLADGMGDGMGARGKQVRMTAGVGLGDWGGAWKYTDMGEV